MAVEKGRTERWVEKPQGSNRDPGAVNAVSFYLFVCRRLSNPATPTPPPLLSF